MPTSAWACPGSEDMPTRTWACHPDLDPGESSSTLLLQVEVDRALALGDGRLQARIPEVGVFLGDEALGRLVARRGAGHHVARLVVGDDPHPVVTEDDAVPLAEGAQGVGAVVADRPGRRLAAVRDEADRPGLQRLALIG